MNGPESFDSFDDLLARTIEFNPTRTEASLRRGILHNAEPARGRLVGVALRALPHRPTTTTARDGTPTSGSSGTSSAELDVPLMLARGMREQSVVDDADEAEVLRRKPDARIVRFEEAGHSIQGDMPVELAQLLDELLG